MPITTSKLFVFRVIGNHPENNHFEKSLGFGKLHKNYNGVYDFFLFFFFSFAIAHLKNFSSCDVIQQIKTSSPNLVDKLHTEKLVNISEKVAMYKIK